MKQWCTSEQRQNQNNNQMNRNIIFSTFTKKAKCVKSARKILASILWETKFINCDRLSSSGANVMERVFDSPLDQLKEKIHEECWVYQRRKSYFYKTIIGPCDFHCHCRNQWIGIWFAITFLCCSSYLAPLRFNSFWN